MTRIGLTQRVEVVEAYGERRDCLDQSWTGLLEAWGYTPVPLATTVDSPRSYLDQFGLGGIILTSGNDPAHLDNAANPSLDRDKFETAAVEWAIDHNIPVLGVCRGLEILNYYFGGSLVPVDNHVDSTHAVSFSSSMKLETQSGTWKSEPNLKAETTKPKHNQIKWPNKITVNSYHDYGIVEKTVSEELVPVGTAPDDTVECLIHPKYPIVGIMWHPERETQSTAFDQQLFRALYGEST